MIDSFIRALKKSPGSNGVFNPWWEMDPENDFNKSAPVIRRNQLKQYFLERIGTAKFLLIGEAIGYQGGHFTGIPMTSEQILLGHKKDKGILPEFIFSGIEPKRTSKPAIKPNGFSEPTGTIVWGSVADFNIDPKSVLIWNAFPWHTYTPEKGFLSNRTPTGNELNDGIHVLIKLKEIFKGINIISVGNNAKKMLQKMDTDALPVRHPAYGGASKFREQFYTIMKEKMASLKVPSTAL